MPGAINTTAGNIAQTYGVYTLGYLAEISSNQSSSVPAPAAVLFNPQGQAIMNFNSPMTQSDLASIKAVAQLGGQLQQLGLMK